MIVLMSEVGITPDTLLNRQLKELNEKENKKYMMFKRENENHYNPVFALTPVKTI